MPRVPGADTMGAWSSRLHRFTARLRSGPPHLHALKAQAHGGHDLLLGHDDDAVHQRMHNRPGQVAHARLHSGLRWALQNAWRPVQWLPGLPVTVLSLRTCSIPGASTQSLQPAHSALQLL